MTVVCYDFYYPVKHFLHFAQSSSPSPCGRGGGVATLKFPSDIDQLTDSLPRPGMIRFIRERKFDFLNFLSYVILEFGCSNVSIFGLSSSLICLRETDTSCRQFLSG